MLVLDSPQIVQETVARWKSQGHSIAFVPTMGCLHAGHMELVRTAQSVATKTVVSIFVNPLQFGAGEDFEKYPRTLDSDLRQLKEKQVDLVFTPTNEDLYPKGFETRVEVGKLGDHLCGKSRPGHFSGVATVCLKLFQITLADVAIFGQKDFQQMRIIKKMVEDLNLPLRIHEHETVREIDGLALSSRNRYLNQQERNLAACIPQAIERAKRAARESDATVASVRALAREALGNVSIDYLEIASERTLSPAPDSLRLDSITEPHLFLAVKIGQTRLIDNAGLHPKDDLH